MAQIEFGGQLDLLPELNLLEGTIYVGLAALFAGLIKGEFSINRRILNVSTK